MRFGAQILRLIILNFVAMIGLGAAPANAAAFMFTFSGAPFGNTAVATGTFAIADATLALVNASPAGINGIGNISFLTMTVTGAPLGNGTFTTPNFTDFDWTSPTALDFSRELVGQMLGNGNRFGDRVGGGGGDFNFFSRGPAPNGYNYFVMSLNGGTNVQVALTSLVQIPGIPEPGAWAMMLIGFGLVGGSVRLQRGRATRLLAIRTGSV